MSKKQKKSSPRVNKSKDELKAQLKQIEKVAHEKALAKLIYPFIKDLDTIYDAQTVLAGLSGYISYGVEQRAAQLTVVDLQVDVSHEEEGPIKQALINLIGLLQSEKAKDAASLLERFGKTLAQYSAAKYMKNPMKDLPVEDIVA